jgi:outer membrane protein assembly factor BamB
MNHPHQVATCGGPWSSARGRRKVRSPRPMRPAPEALERRECLAASAWSMYSYNARGSRDNTSEHVLGPANVSQLGINWSFPTPTPISGTPAVVGGKVFAGDLLGNVYALDEATGALIWETNVGSGVSDSPMVTPGGVVVLGNGTGDILGLSARSGQILWRVHPNNYGSAVAIYGSATQVGGDVAIGFASNEEGASSGYQYQFDGSVALINPANGNVIWQTYTLSPDAYAAGWRGAAVWSTPTYDKGTNTLFVTTGNYYQSGTTSDPGRGDATIALNASTGAIEWVNQLVKGDIWNGTIVPGPDNPDADLADSAKIFNLPHGGEAVGVGSKDGFYFVMNAATGAPINGPNGTQLEVGSDHGGLFANGAVDQAAGRVFQNGNDWPDGSASGSGDLYAVSLNGKLLWDFKTPAQDSSGVAIANGVVYFQSFDGYLYMLNANASSASGAFLANVYTGGQFSGPAVADGHVFEGTGDVWSYVHGNGSLTGSIISLGLVPSPSGHPAAVPGRAFGGTSLSSSARPDESKFILGSIGPELTSASPDSAQVVSTAMASEPAAPASDASPIAARIANPVINQGQLASNRKNPWSSLLQVAAGLQG